MQNRFKNSLDILSDKNIKKLLESNCDLENLKNVLEEINKSTDKILIKLFGEKGKDINDFEELNLYGFNIEDVDLINEINEILTKNSEDFIDIDVLKDIEEEINNIMNLCYKRDNIRNLKNFNIESYFNEYVEKNVLCTCEYEDDKLVERVSEIVLDIEEALIDYAKKDIIKLLNSLHLVKEKTKGIVTVLEEISGYKDNHNFSDIIERETK